MGARGSKVHFASMKILLKQLSEVYLPDDRNVVIDTFEQIDQRLLVKKTFASDVEELKRHDGFYVMLKVVKKLTDDIEVVTLFIQIIDSVKFETPVVMDFIQFGGLDVVEKCTRLHTTDDYLAMTSPRILKVVLAVGAKASIQEIQNEGTNMRLCHCCQEIIERQKHPLGLAANIVVVKPCDRANRVLRFMDNYVERADVQIAGLDAILNYVRSADAKATARSTDAVKVVAKALKRHKALPAIVWRACLALSIIAGLSSELAIDVAATTVHEDVIESFTAFMAEPLVQIQIMRLFASLLQWPKSHRIVHKSPSAVDFLKNVVEDVDKAKKRLEEELRERDRKAVLALKGAKGFQSQALTLASTGALSSPAATAASLASAAGSQPPSAVSNETAQQVLPLPVHVYRFVRETGGKAFREKSAKKGPTQVFKQRKNFDERPKFGTVHDKVFVSGQDGLIRGEDEDDDGNMQRKPADWESHLQYGEAGKKPHVAKR